MKRLILLIALSIFCGSVSAQSSSAPQKIVLKGSKLGNFYRIDEGVYRSDQPSSRDFELLEQYGIREVLNLRNWHDDRREARRTNLKLHHLYTEASTIDENDIVKAMKIIKERRGPIVIHCWHGSDRTGAVVAMYRIIFQNWSKDQAINELREGGFGFHEQFDEIPAMIRRADIEAIKREVFFKENFLKE